MVTTMVCKGCGRVLLETESVCPECNTTVVDETVLSAKGVWEQELKRVKLHWVVVVILFWVTLAVTAGLFVIHGSAYLNELVFLSAIFMVLGIYLKTKVMLVQRKMPK